MRVLLDECVDRRLAKNIIGHDVKTVAEMGWTSKRNGELLALAEQAFDVFITILSTELGTLEKNRRIGGRSCGKKRCAPARIAFRQE